MRRLVDETVSFVNMAVIALNVSRAISGTPSAWQALFVDRSTLQWAPNTPGATMDK
ncbi:hypothetical protein [Phyllobacterium ifriqiyense]|uniref:hypothetical protein n=1 Tax=Phyllobacterium ifriqiyense TaxID=314238 RepID=UPI0033936B56